MVGEDNITCIKRSDSINKKVDYIFEKFDLDKDNMLSLDEFIHGCLNDEYLNQMLKMGYLSPGYNNSNFNNNNLKTDTSSLK